MYSIFWRSFARAVDYERVRNIRSWYADTVGLHFNPADIQSIGIGLAAFLATVLTAFVFISARHERLGRPMWITLAACTVWAWFGFLYHVVPGLSLAREMRVVSVMGIAWISMSQMNFCLLRSNQTRRIGRGGLGHPIVRVCRRGGFDQPIVCRHVRHAIHCRCASVTC